MAFQHRLVVICDLLAVACGVASGMTSGDMLAGYTLVIHQLGQWFSTRGTALPRGHEMVGET